MMNTPVSLHVEQMMFLVFPSICHCYIYEYTNTCVCSAIFLTVSEALCPSTYLLDSKTVAQLPLSPPCLPQTHTNQHVHKQALASIPAAVKDRPWAKPKSPWEPVVALSKRHAHPACFSQDRTCRCLPSPILLHAIHQVQA